MITERALGSWILPQPKEKERYIPIPRFPKNTQIPFGYKQDPDDENWLIPIPLELKCLEMAKKHIKQYSFREVAAWLTTQSGRQITEDGLRKRLKNERRRNLRRKFYRTLAEQYKEALKRAAQYEQVLGKKEATGYFESSEYVSLFDNDNSDVHRA